MPKRKSPGCVYTKHVEDYLHMRYLYQPRKDELFIFIDGYPKNRKISLGKCKEEMKKDLQVLIREYNAAVEEYKKANDEVQKLFEEKEEIQAEIEANNGWYDGRPHEGGDKYETFHMNGRWCDVMDGLYKEAIPERNEWSNVVAHLYFVISMK